MGNKKNKCCRCGFCCMQGPCEYAILIEAPKNHKYGICPLLEYDEKTQRATCLASDSELTQEGTGCDTNLIIMKNSKDYKTLENVFFRGLTNEQKKEVASNRWSNRIEIYEKLKDIKRG